MSRSAAGAAHGRSGGAPATHLLYYYDDIKKTRRAAALQRSSCRVALAGTWDRNL
jgi:hypothetical protein